MARQPRSLHGNVAVVTGGGRGIGKAIALALASEGARVAIGDVDVRVGRGRRGRARRRRRSGSPLDVTDRPGFTAFLDEVEQRLGPIDVLVNNAGIMTVGPFDEEDDATAVRMVEINLHGVIHGTKEADAADEAARHRPHRQRRLERGPLRLPQPVTYCATKYGVVGLSEAVSRRAARDRRRRLRA